MKKIQDIKIIEKLKWLLNLEDWTTERFLMSETVIPVIDIRATKQILKLVNVKTASTTVAGYYPLAHVPLGKRWTIMSIGIEQDSGNSTFSYWGVTDTDVSKIMLMAEITAASEYLMGILPAPLILEQYQRLIIYVNAVTTASIFGANMWVLEEDIQPQRQ